MGSCKLISVDTLSSEELLKIVNALYMPVEQQQLSLYFVFVGQVKLHFNALKIVISCEKRCEL